MSGEGAEEAVKTVNVPMSHEQLKWLAGIVDSKERELDKIVAKAKLPTSTGIQQMDADNAKLALVKVKGVKEIVSLGLALFPS